MGARTHQLYAGQPTHGVIFSAYTVPAGKTVIVKSFLVSANGGGPHRAAGLYAAPGGLHIGSPFDQAALTVSEPFLLDVYHVLTAGQEIDLYHEFADGQLEVLISGSVLEA